MYTFPYIHVNRFITSEGLAQWKRKESRKCRNKQNFFKISCMDKIFYR